MMFNRPAFHTRLLLIMMVLAALPALGQGSKADYERANEIPKRFSGRVLQRSIETVWVTESVVDHSTIGVWYRKDLGQGNYQWTAVDPVTGKQRVAFDHKKLASQLNEITKKNVAPHRLPIKKLRVYESVMLFNAFDREWSYGLASETLDKRSPGPFGHGGRRMPRSSPRSPDRNFFARIVDHNVVMFPLDERGKPLDKRAVILTTDGINDDTYINQFYWSFDSKRLTVIKRKPGDSRRVTVIDSSPDKQIQPETQSYFYRKPGDKVDIDRPVMFDVTTGKRIEIKYDLAPNPFSIRGVRWKQDSSAFIYEYNQRGHRAYRVIEVDAKTGTSRAVIDEQSKTFITHYHKKFLYYLDDSDELIWMSERDGWNHLYLYDWKTGKVKRQLTQGEWVVRSVDRVDEKNRTLWFWAGGIHAGQDPYHLHYCRVDLDTGKVTPLTSSDGTHTDVSVSEDGKTLVTTWSRVDHPPVHELRSAVTGKLIKEIARADASKLKEAGWIAPERFHAKGRDGKTDIYGIIIKPTNFDPKKKYPVIEQIYAGPHDSHVPKRFYGMHWNMRLAELGFIVVQIDGMGTSNRSKAFHDVCWKNLKDAGFPDRIAWMKAAGKTRPWMDLSRVGIYGGSAGGQNAMRAVLDHADFYKAAATDCGCHDNRMDKIWWNEQWMGWPVDESYAKSSNVDDAHKLGGKLLLTVGELDKNVDPASTMQVVDALIKANKDFEFMVFPGGGHGAGEGRYGRRLRADFFVRHLHGKTPRWE